MPLRVHITVAGLRGLLAALLAVGLGLEGRAVDQAQVAGGLELKAVRCV